MTKASIILSGLIAASAMASAAQPQQENFQDRAGRVMGPSATDSNSWTLFFDANGRITGRESTDRQSSTVFFSAEIMGRETTDSVGIPIYDSHGRVIIRKSGFER